jgi:hypothetical protein
MIFSYTLRRGNEVGETCGRHGSGQECVQGFGGKARRKETTWKTKDGIRMDRRETDWWSVEWIQLAQDEPSGSGATELGCKLCLPWNFTY